MSAKDYIATLLDMEDVVLKNIEEAAQEITIQIVLTQKVQQCSHMRSDYQPHS